MCFAPIRQPTTDLALLNHVQAVATKADVVRCKTLLCTLEHRALVFVSLCQAWQVHRPATFDDLAAALTRLQQYSPSPMHCTIDTATTLFPIACALHIVFAFIWFCSPSHSECHRLFYNSDIYSTCSTDAHAPLLNMHCGETTFIFCIAM